MENTRLKLLSLLDQWEKYPEEAAKWRITYQYGEPDLYLNQPFPYWWPRGRNSTLESLTNLKK